MTHDILTQFHSPYQLCIYCKAEFHRVDGVKQPLLILLQVLVIGKRKPLDRHEHRHEMSDNAAGLSTHKLGDIRIFLLRHHRRARTVRVVQLDKRELS